MVFILETKLMKHCIRSAPLFLNQNESLRIAVERSVELCADCILVTDDFSRIVGILTTLDIIKAIHFCGVDQLERVAIKTLVMTPFEGAIYASFLKDIKKIHADFNLGYFPILRKEKPATAAQVLGLLSLADIGAHYLSILPDS